MGFILCFVLFIVLRVYHVTHVVLKFSFSLLLYCTYTTKMGFLKYSICIIYIYRFKTVTVVIQLVLVYNYLFLDVSVIEDNQLFHFR